ncbi:MAG: 30S ribosomal protein S16 [Planctomycetes bacterium]|nr:30S ribosomal protein S16 [Planctomycetota bacterium]
MVTLRFSRTGRKHIRRFRLVATDHRNPRDGRCLEILGHYDPTEKANEKKLVFKKERVEFWLGKGAQASNTVWTLLRKHGINKATARELRKKLSGAQA